MKKICIPLILIFVCFIFCEKHAQPQSGSSGSIGNIEKKIIESTVPANQNLSLEVQVRLLMHDADSISPLSKETVTAADSVFSLETEITRLSASLFMENDPAVIFDSIASLVFDKLKITFEKNENDLNAVFPEKIIQSRRGTCLGISLLVLQIGEKLGFPLHGVLVPGHFFVRFDDGMSKRNFEPLRHGEHMPELWYRETWPTNDTVRYSLRNYTKKEVTGVVCYVIGNSLMSQEKYVGAVQFFNRASGTFPEFIESAGNEAIACDKVGDTEKGVTILGELLKKTPSLDRIHSRYAPLLLKVKRYSDAESEYVKALKDEPGNPELLYGYAMTLFLLKKCEDASVAVSGVIDSKPDYEAASQLKMQISQQCGQ